MVKVFKLTPDPKGMLNIKFRNYCPEPSFPKLVTTMDMFPDFLTKNGRKSIH
jgi:hypothetical protein